MIAQRKHEKTWILVLGTTTRASIRDSVRKAIGRRILRRFALRSRHKAGRQARGTLPTHLPREGLTAYEHSPGHRSIELLTIREDERLSLLRPTADDRFYHG